MGVDYIVVHFV